MPISASIKQSIANSSWIRRMFEEGLAMKQKLGEDQVFDFSLGNPDLEPPAEFHRILQDLLQSPQQGQHGYMANAGFPEVRAAMAEKVSREHGLTFRPEHVVMCVGAAGGMNVVMKTLLDPGSEVLVSRPYFVEYGSYVGNHGGLLRTVDSTPDFLLDPAALAGAFTERTRAVIINSPNNPTGRLYPESVISELGRTLLAHAASTGNRIVLVVDEPYRDLVYGDQVTPPVACHYPHTIVVNSFSKSLSLPGERIGYIAVAPECDELDSLMAGLIMCNRTLGFVNAPALMQRAVARLTNVKVDISPYRRRRDILSAALRKAGIEFAEPDGAFYLFCRAPGGNDTEFAGFLKEFHILGVPGTGFGLPGWFRLSYAVPDRVVEGAAPRFVEAMQAWRSRREP